MSKAKLVILTILTITLLVTLWTIPAITVWMVICIVDAFWLQVVLWVASLIWILVFRPWDMLRKDYRNRILSDLRKSFNALTS